MDSRRVALCAAFIALSFALQAQPPFVDRSRWRVVRCDSNETEAKDQRAQNAIDGNPNTIWHTEWKKNSPGHPHEIVIDFGQPEHVEAVTYLPRPSDGDDGNIKDYQVYLGTDLDSLQLAASGTFPGAIEHNRKVIPVAAREARYLRFVSLSEVHGRSWASAAEIGVLHVRLADVIQEFSSKSQGGNPEIIFLGEEFWSSPWMPNLTRPDHPIALSAANRIDIVILGDGYLQNQREMFLWEASNWYRRLLGLHPFQETRGAFRVRAIWTPSRAPAGQPDSFYHVGVDAAGVANSVSPAMSRSVFGVLDGIDLNRRTTGDRYSHAFAVLLVKPCAGFGCGISGRPLFIHSPDKSRAISAALGDDSLHEFLHAMANLSDEYIAEANSIGKPQVRTEESLMGEDHQVLGGNLSMTPKRNLLRWKHIAPGSALNPDPESLIGRLWRGGENEFGVWHSEPMCLMNGKHENWDPQMHSRGAWLRDMTRLCFWCEELTAATVWYLTGMLGDGTDGVSLWSHWVALRPDYYRALQGAERIAEQNAVYKRSIFIDSPLSSDPVSLSRDDPPLASGFRIVHAKSKRALAESSGRVLFSGSGMSGSVWVLEGDTNGFVRLKNMARGCYLQMQDGTRAVSCLEAAPGDWSAQFVLTRVSPGRYSIWNRWTNRILTISDKGTPEAGAEDVRNPATGVWILEQEGSE